jgi:hypothetical protein
MREFQGRREERGEGRGGERIGQKGKEKEEKY